MKFDVSGLIWEWRGPSPFYFLSMSPEASAAIKEIAAGASYGWGAIPVLLTSGEHKWTTSIFTKDGKYIVPLKKAIRSALHLGAGDSVNLTVEITT